MTSKEVTILATISHISGNSYVFTHRIYEAPLSDPSFISHHFHSEYELLFVLGGDVTYVLEDKKYKLEPYDMILTRPSRYHYIHIDSDMPYERYNIIFPASFLGEELINMIPENADVFSCSQLPVVIDCMKKTERYAEMGEDTFGILLRCLLTEVFYNLLKHPVSDHKATDSVSPLISASLSYINENLYTIKGISDISSALFISENYFFRAFKNEMKISPKKYITYKRLLEAQRRITGGERPTDVYVSCGFSSYTAFFKCYVRYFGISPSQQPKQKDATADNFIYRI